jgi:hypothetical protein
MVDMLYVIKTTYYQQVWRMTKGIKLVTPGPNTGYGDAGLVNPRALYHSVFPFFWIQMELGVGR